LDYNRNIQRTGTTRTALAGGDARLFSAKVDIRRDSVGAYRAVDLAQGAILNECFHKVASLHPTKKTEQWLCQNS